MPLEPSSRVPCRSASYSPQVEQTPTLLGLRTLPASLRRETCQAGLPASSPCRRTCGRRSDLVCRDVDGPASRLRSFEKPSMWNRPDPSSRCLAGPRQMAKDSTASISNYSLPSLGRLITTDIRHSFLTFPKLIAHHDHHASWTWASARRSLFFLRRADHHNRGLASILSNLRSKGLWLG